MNLITYLFILVFSGSFIVKSVENTLAKSEYSTRILVGALSYYKIAIWAPQNRWIDISAYNTIMYTTKLLESLSSIVLVNYVLLMRCT